MNALSTPLGLRQIWRHPMPYQRERPMTRLVVKSVLTLAKSRVLEVEGLEHTSAARDPFIIVPNHNQRMEAVVLPALLLYHREGKAVHFLADWPSMLVPFVGLALRCGEVIVITQKRAKVRFLNVFKRFFEKSESAFDQAQNKLRNGASLGIFAEATMNRHPTHLLRGQAGAAKLSLLTGAPIVPAGIRFPEHDPEQPIPDGAPMAVRIGPPIAPPEVTDPDPKTIRAFHAQVMGEIARLSGKQWHPKAQRRRNHVPDRSA